MHPLSAAACADYIALEVIPTTDKLYIKVSMSIRRCFIQSTVSCVHLLSYSQDGPIKTVCVMFLNFLVYKHQIVMLKTPESDVKHILN